MIIIVSNLLPYYSGDKWQAEDYGRLALYETEDVQYRRDAETFMADYTDARKKQHARMMV